MDTDYNSNSSVQRQQGHTVERHLTEVTRRLRAPEGGRAYVVVDYGSGPGNNAAEQLSHLAKSVHDRTMKSLQIAAYFVDQQDKELWDQLKEYLDACFSTFPDKEQYWLSYKFVNRSFYDNQSELAPGSVDIGWSSIAAHWLPEIPIGLPEAFAANQVPVDDPTRKKWAEAAASSWHRWLALRAIELKPGGYLVVALPGATDDGGFVGRTAWDVFSEVKRDMLATNQITRAQAEQLCTREYWRTTREVLGPMFSDELLSKQWELQFYELAWQPSPFLPRLAAGEVDKRACAGSLVASFRAFLSQEVTNALDGGGRAGGVGGGAAAGDGAGGGATADAFWDRIARIGEEDPSRLDLQFIVHHIVLRRK